MKNLRNLIQSLPAEKHSELNDAIEGIVSKGSAFNRAQRRKIKKFWDKNKQKCVS